MTHSVFHLFLRGDTVILVENCRQWYLWDNVLLGIILATPSAASYLFLTSSQAVGTALMAASTSVSVTPCGRSWLATMMRRALSKLAEVSDMNPRYFNCYMPVIQSAFKFVLSTPRATAKPNPPPPVEKRT